VKGGSGAGKTTLAKSLARRFGVPFVELDALQHGPNWVQASAEELCARVTAVLDGAEGWIVDGNYDSRLGTLVIERAQLIVWLDLPLATKLLRLVRRTTRRVLTREALWNGNRETWRLVLFDPESLFVWAVRSHFRHRRTFPRLLEGRPAVRLRTPAEVDAWLRGMTANYTSNRRTQSSAPPW
jgi:hypothetical protein